MHVLLGCMLVPRRFQGKATKQEPRIWIRGDVKATNSCCNLLIYILDM